MRDFYDRVHCRIRRARYRKRRGQNRRMKVNIIFNEAGWIIQKFACSMRDELVKMGIDAVISEEYDRNADINHYFFPNHAPVSNGNVTFMITHVDQNYKLQLIRSQTEKGAVGVCMSRETRDRLISCGVRPDRVCYINPAQDQQIMPRKIKLGFTNRVYNDSRKRESMLLDVCQKVDNRFFKFYIMGAGWESIVKELGNMGFEVEYYPDFDKQKYNEMMVDLDYYCYFGFDEGSMGYLDALSAGIGTIVTPQGYHLDSGIEITYPVSTIDDIVEALHDIEKKRFKAIDFTEKWTWESYAKKHLEIWKYMLDHDDLDEILQSRGWYTDGIYSLLLR